MAAGALVGAATNHMGNAFANATLLHAEWEQAIDDIARPRRTLPPAWCSRL